MRKYVDDYEIVIEEDEKGREKKKAVYRGNYYEVEIEKGSLSRFKWINILLLILIITFHVVGGFIDNQGMYRFYIALPYVITFLPLYFLTTGILRLPTKKHQMRRDEVDLTFLRVKKASKYLLFVFLISIVGEVIFIIFFANNNNQLEYTYVFIELIAGTAAYLLFYIQKIININEVPSKS